MNEIVESLKTISSEYRPIPFWSWNDRLEPEELKRQIRWMHRNGIGGFFMHAREGLKTEYLSEEWMNCIAACCDTAQQLGMHPWVYDENGWPSGFVGGALLEDPDNRDMYIETQTGAFDPEADLSYDLTGDKLVLTNGENPAGVCLNLYLRKSASTVDILNPRVVDQFLSATHEKYKQRFGKLFPQAIRGFFTDEPQYYRPKTPYTPMVREYFREQYGQDIGDQLGLLFVEKEGYRQFRYRYWLALQTLMLKNFAQKVFYWCDDNQVRLTGHYVDEITMGFQIMCCAGVMPFYEFEHIPGIDWLGVTSDNELAPRQLGSAAQQLGKKQTLTETFGCCGWDISPNDLKRIAGFQYACGVNLMCHHLVPYSEHGQRKRDYPAHFHEINPWIGEHFKDFNDYFTRLGYLLAEGEAPVNVAMLHPIRSCYLDYKRDLYPGFGVEDLDAELLRSCRLLSSWGINYHFLDETLLERHGRIEGRQIICGKCTYDYLVLPQMLTMGLHTKELLRQYVQNGGKVLLLQDKPSFVEGEPYDYSWLVSSCSLEQILKAQPFSVQNTETELYYAYRVLDGKPFLFVQNASASTEYSQTFRFDKDIRSFTAVDLVTYTCRQLPLEVTLAPNEGLLLFPSGREPEVKKELTPLEPQMTDSQVSFETNFLTLDTIRYSKDGYSFSEPISRNRLFAQLLEERYEGRLWLKYDFELQFIPDRMTILAEKHSILETKVNGVSFQLQDRYEKEPSLCMADISNMLQEGLNSFETVIFWKQSQSVYQTLFGDGVTESLKNCIVYDSEIESVYLAGKFGVYSNAPYESIGDSAVCGHSFYIGRPPTTVTEPTTDGLPFFRGKLRMMKRIRLDTPNVLLRIPGRYLAARVFLNGVEAGTAVFGSQVDISHVAVCGENLLEIEYLVGNRNLLGPFHNLEDDIYVGPGMFNSHTLPDAANGSTRYKLARFFKKNGSL